MRFLLIITTLDRTSELRRFLDSACDQTYRQFELVIVDQNEDERVTQLLDEYRDVLSIRHVRHLQRGASNGRNAGLNRQWDADIVAFPDDDCWFPPDLLARVEQFFRTHPEWDGLTGRSVTEEGLPSNGRWHSEPGRVTHANAWNRATCFSMFFRSSFAERVRFDVTLGCGANTLWGGGEDLDYLLQVITLGARVYFDPTLTVYHPEWSTTGETFSVRDKALRYARGMGRVLRKHNYSLHLVAYHIIRPLGGTLLSLARLNTWGSAYHWAVLTGRWQGWSASMENGVGVGAAASRSAASPISLPSLPVVTSSVPASTADPAEKTRSVRTAGSSL